MEGSRRHRAIPRAELAVGALGLLIIVALIGSLVREALRSSEPPVLTVRVDSIVARGGAHMVYVRLMNGAPQTAADVALQGRLFRDTTTAEEQEITFPYVPGHSDVGGALRFERDTVGLSLKLWVRGYREP